MTASNVRVECAKAYHLQGSWLVAPTPTTQLDRPSQRPAGPPTDPQWHVGARRVRVDDEPREVVVLAVVLGDAAPRDRPGGRATRRRPARPPPRTARPAGRTPRAACPPPGRRPFEQIFDDIASGSRAESRAGREVQDDEPDGWGAPALEASSLFVDEISSLPVGEPINIVDAELVQLEPDRTGLPARSNAERVSKAGRRTYTLDDFE